MYLDWVLKSTLFGTGHFLQGENFFSLGKATSFLSLQE